MDRAKRGAGPRGSRAAAIKLISAMAVVLASFVAVALLGARPVAAARPTATPFPTITPGRHVYDYGNLFSPKAVSIAESLAAKIEAEGGGRVVVYTADMMALPDEATLAKA
ncbi:MAG TPA: hypothetical protein VF337_09540, partial [Candidatus Limnocylindrales bacterium]